ncbi:MAG TPA: nucleoside-diphosphate sugar epimerase/dehydratase [Bryobacteraceae bacterium]|nr:nucleoside-diphosphate sugar epimerase/dehydratase [Bryobacteraceae bacterium]
MLAFNTLTSAVRSRYTLLRHQLITTFAGIALLELALLFAFLVRFEFSLPQSFVNSLFWAALVWAPVKTATLYAFGLHRVSWRYFSLPDLKQLALANIAASAVTGGLALTVYPHAFPRSVLVLDFCFVLLLTGAVRASARMLGERACARRKDRRRTLIYGAGAAGVMLLRESQSNAAFRHLICAFVDDSPAKQRLTIHGISVAGYGSHIAEIVKKLDIDEVLIAIPSASASDMIRIIGHCNAAGVIFRTMPAMSEIISGRGLTRQIRDVAVDDVLGRSAVELDRAGIHAKLHGRVALVTGAAGSIGSELCRQIAACRPAALIALDIAETPLFHIERELRQTYPNLKLHAEIASIQNVQRLHEIFAQHRPSVVYHAAAYKHVPMMESTLFEALENNVIGTFNVAVAAAEYHVDDFVMISSDKAVRPTNIMGATKRTAELVIRSLQNGGPRYVSVRFGNVLGSNGSVVPIFKEQIAAGGPVTVTHPEMTRYFMTIPEAVQLVLQASTMGKGGEIFVLDMGAPVKILDLARQLIVLSGLKPDEDIRIEFSGMRPGEKLYEELRFSDEEVLPTHHSKIKVFAGNCLPDNRMPQHLARLRAACARRDVKAALFELKEIEPDYNPSKEILTRAFEGDLQRLAEAVSSAGAVTPSETSLVMASGD